MQRIWTIKRIATILLLNWREILIDEYGRLKGKSEQKYIKIDLHKAFSDAYNKILHRGLNITRLRI